MSPDGFGLSAQLAILKRSLHEIFDLVIANRRDRKSQDLKEALRAESTWKEAPKSVRNGRSAVCIFLYHCTLRGPPGCLPGRLGPESCSPARRASWGRPTPALRARTPPRPRAAPPPRRAGPSPAPAAAAARQPRTPAEATGSARLRAELQRWPDAKCKCKLLWKPRQRRVPNPERDGAPGAAGSAPPHPGPPAPGRPRAQAPARGRLEVLLLRPQHPAPEMPGMQIEQNLLSLCIASKRAWFWLPEPLKTTRTPGKPGHAPGFSIEDP